MTSMSLLFSSYNPCSSKEKVRIADGSLLLCQVNGLFLSCPLLSIARITLELNGQVIFYSHYCLFKDLVTGRMIGSGSLRDGLYYLDS
jgi:hypothetical protein